MADDSGPVIDFAEAKRRLAAAKNRAHVIATVREAARAVCRADGITFVLREGDQCHYVEEDAIAPLWKGRRFPITDCISGWAMTHKRSAVIEDITQDARIPQDVYRPTFVRSLVMTPLGTEHVAAIGAYWKAPRRFSKDELARIRSFTRLVGEALSSML